ncbi:hypothetical protein LCGC14_1051830 [marine sediment metagenome]|uniref:Uncharacterized protein n=1 Tax=marine sediment metagenome TaxID=412755 RepID=A0A0F9MT32_9ZZZZ
MQYFEFVIPYAVGFGAILAILILVKHDKEWALLPGILMAIWAMVSLIVFFDTLSTTADLEAFEVETLAAYEYTVDETKQAVLDGDALTDFSDQAASKRLAELRNRVFWYNKLLARLNKFGDLPLIGVMVANNDLSPILLGPEPSGD